MTIPTPLSQLEERERSFDAQIQEMISAATQLQRAPELWKNLQMMLKNKENELIEERKKCQELEARLATERMASERARSESKEWKDKYTK